MIALSPLKTKYIQMKKIIFLAFLLLGSVITKASVSINNDKDTLLTVFDGVNNRLLNDVQGLSDEQVNFKPSAERWSIGQCIEHITKTEGMLLGMVQEMMKKPANPEMRSKIKGEDKQVLTMIEDRSKKFKAPDELQPSKTNYDLDELIKNLEKQRAMTLAFINQTTLESLRNHIMQTPTKDYADAYRSLLFIAGHSLRHTAQIEEVKTAPGYPSK